MFKQLKKKSKYMNGLEMSIKKGKLLKESNRNFRTKIQNIWNRKVTVGDNSKLGTAENKIYQWIWRQIDRPTLRRKEDKKQGL